MGLRPAGRGFPASWQESVQRANELNLSLFSPYGASGDEFLTELISPISWESMSTGQIGLILEESADLAFWQGRPGSEPEDLWWPEGLLLQGGSVIIYPAESQPELKWSFFALLPGTQLQLGVIEFPISTAFNRQPRVTATGGDDCSYRVRGELNDRTVECLTLDCNGGCDRVVTALDGGRRSISCLC